MSLEKEENDSGFVVVLRNQKDAGLNPTSFINTLPWNGKAA